MVTCNNFCVFWRLFFFFLPYPTNNSNPNPREPPLVPSQIVFSYFFLSFRFFLSMVVFMEVVFFALVSFRSLSGFLCFFVLVCFYCKMEKRINLLKNKVSQIYSSQPSFIFHLKKHSNFLFVCFHFFLCKKISRGGRPYPKQRRKQNLRYDLNVIKK